MKAPLIAVISVGIAAAVPAVASSAIAPNDGQAIEPAPAGPAGIDPRQPIGTVTIDTTTNTNRHPTPAARAPVPEAQEPREPADRAAATDGECPAGCGPPSRSSGPTAGCSGRSG